MTFEIIIQETLFENGELNGMLGNSGERVDGIGKKEKKKQKDNLTLKERCLAEEACSTHPCQGL
jgi:hypothetical protein